LLVPEQYSTIQAAVKSANTGDTVFVGEGTYFCGPENVIFIDKSISLIGKGANNTIINGEYEQYYPRPWGWDTITIAASNVVIKGFTLTNCENAITIQPDFSCKKW
jgi:pectin methylesterase-like acyl-CoA thioesterase